MGRPESMTPLTPAVFHILLALFAKERHGYDIMQHVKADSPGAVKMGPGTLYGSLDRMMDAGFVAKADRRDPRRVYLRTETDRLSRLAAVARGQLRTA